MKRLIIVIPIMIIVALVASWFLGKNYSDVPLQTRILIISIGTLFSGVISYFLFQDDVDRISPKKER
ncbi:hypothetical protein JOC86_002243 [Bacillus pakistanensis]|uniref:Histidine kinase n=1 Tax=Rossellomorea pakistanensis TaxID=992288 RepID=A0ABS2NDR1_9BACI|nr:hypothetical protein [Bacillus pakistanensis]MBM7585701.1 hypothetical protein [Bacillus pakistanensis]